MRQKTLKLQYIQKDKFGREVFLAPAGTLRKKLPTYLVDIAFDYENHQGRDLHTIAFAQGETENPFFGEPCERLKPVWDVVVLNEDERKIQNENPYKRTYAYLSRLKMDCQYHIGYARLNGAKPIENIEEHIQKMRDLWNSLPENAKPEWLSKEDIEELRNKIMSSEIYIN